MADAKSVFVKRRPEKIDFYLRDSEGTIYYLCSQKFYDSLYEFFKVERRISDFTRGRKRAAKVVQNMLDKLPKYIKYVMKYEAV